MMGLVRPFSKKEKVEVTLPPADEFEESEDLRPTLNVTQPKPVAKKPTPQPEPEVLEDEIEPVDSGEVIAAIEYHLQKAFQLLQTFK